jgi:hypothetical protein
MSRRSTLLVVILTLTLAAAWATAALAQSAQNADAEADKAPDVAALAAEVQALRQQVRRLEERVAAYESRDFVWLKEGAVPPRVVTPADRLPGGRKPQGYINGVPYYIVPLEAAPERASTHAPRETAPAAPNRRR